MFLNFKQHQISFSGYIIPQRLIFISRSPVNKRARALRQSLGVTVQVGAEMLYLLGLVKF